MKPTLTTTFAWAAVTAAALLVAGTAVGQQKEIVIGVQCDRTGAGRSSMSIYVQRTRTTST